MSPTSGPSHADRSYCRFTSGSSAAPRDGAAVCGPTGIDIDLGAAGPRHLWPYASLSATEPLRPNAIDVLLRSSDAPGATLFVQGPEFASTLRRHAPHLGARAETWRRLWPWLLILLLAAAFFAATYATGWSPLKSVATELPESWRQRLGDATRASMTEGHKQCIDAAGVAALERLTERLSKASPVTTFDVRVYDWPLMNAFAVPGGEIVLARGLLDKAESPDEVAGILAHEMGHGIELHPETAIIRSIGLAAAAEVMMGGTGGGSLANAGLVLAQLGYSRSAERQADQWALELLKGSGIGSKGLADFFARVIATEGDDQTPAGAANPLGWLRTHPPAAERAAAIRRQAEYPASPALDARSWQALKTICRTTVEQSKRDGG